MKHLKLLLGLFTSFLFYSTTSAQFFSTNNPPGRFMDNHPFVYSVGVGNFGGATLPQSILHVNSNLTTSNPSVLLGNVFQTTGPATQDNSWRMYTGAGNGTQSFSITANTNFGGVEITTTQNQEIDFLTNNTQRMHINANAGVTTSGFVGIGNDFHAPRSRLHLNEMELMVFV
jgi:hypothetical protein